jgi:pilus assembly protein CpaF
MYTRENFLKALGPLAPLYTEKDIQEIMVDAPERTLVEREGRLENVGRYFDSAGEIIKVIESLAGLTNGGQQPGETVWELSFPGGEVRALAVLPPTALNGPALVIRKLTINAQVTWENLIKWNSVTQEGRDFLQQALRVPVNLLVAGGTGSGKTTLANRILELLPAGERLIIVENNHEMQASHPMAVYLECGGSNHGGLDRMRMEDLIVTGSKMRPDWLVIGELLGAEAMRAVEVLGRGHSGLTTIHAESAEDALARLEAMCLTANLGLGLAEIRNLISAALRLITYQRRMPDGSRKLVEIVELRGLEQGRYVLERLFRFNPQTNRLEATGVKPGW